MPTPDVTLYTNTTPNGYPISICLEELGVTYDTKFISFDKKDQKTDWFKEINPNQRIPAVTLHKEGDQHLFESSAILLYLADTYDTQRKISFDPVKERALHYEQLQWLMWAHGGLGPMQGQSNHFSRYAPEKVPYGIDRYQKEGKRLWQILEDRLASREWLVGDRCSLAEIKIIPWLAMGPWACITDLEFTDFPRIKAWIDRFEARPAVQKGLTVPKPRIPMAERLKNADQAIADAQKSFGFSKA